MPELPELHGMSNFINEKCSQRTFCGVSKSAVHKNEELVVPFDKFTIRSESRGKEIRLLLTRSSDEADQDREGAISVLMKMGMV